MSIETRLVDYSDQSTALQGFLAYDDSRSGPRPTVLIAHQWDGRSPFVEERACALASTGVAAFALDMYGEGVLGKSTDENMKLMTPLMEDRKKLALRMQAGLDAASKQDVVDCNRIAAIGYCFGGLCVLDLARAGASVRGVASFHGLLKPPAHIADNKIAAKILVLHGAEDPMTPMEDVIAFKQEMTTAEADWQIHIYGHAKHAFAVPGANNTELGLKHDANAERRSWKAALDFLSEALA